VRGFTVTSSFAVVVADVAFRVTSSDVFPRCYLLICAVKCLGGENLHISIHQPGSHHSLTGEISPAIVPQYGQHHISICNLTYSSDSVKLIALEIEPVMLRN